LHIYTRKQRWKFFLLAGAIVIGLLTSLYTNDLVQSLETEEKQKIETWAQAQQYLSNTDIDVDAEFMAFCLSIVQKNETIPLITVDDEGRILYVRNVRLYDKEGNRVVDYGPDVKLATKSLNYLDRQLEIMKSQHEPILLDLGDSNQYTYYKDSVILSRIQLYPLVQLAVIFIFIFIAYFAFSTSRKVEQNQVWVGMSKETAHQLGTPISSLMAWIELLKMRETDQKMLAEVEKDVNRLETIADRFSKIGSAPVLVPENVLSVLNHAIAYLKNRSSDKVRFTLNFGDLDELYVPLNVALFDWVIENLCKNAIDAMNGVGTIEIAVKDQAQVVYIDITDSGKGLNKSNYKVIFQPGYTTKPRGWGLGLSLVRRIIENYHSGKVFVKSSDIGKGTTFRIVLKK
jgi:signal transduction histidine kinase